MLANKKDLPKPYPSPYKEGEFFSPGDVQRGKELITANIPLGLGSAQISPISLPSTPSILTMTPPMGPPMPPPQPEQDDSSNFLGSLIAQGVAGIGTGLMGGSASDIQRSAGMFDSMRSQQASRDRAKLLMDPKSKESEARRKAYKAVGLDVPDTFSYTDLNDPTVLQGLKGQAEQRKLASMPRGGIGVGGVGKPKIEKESKDQSTANKYTAEADSLRNQLIKYKKAVKAIPRLGGAAQKATAEALQKDILLTIKNIKETGSLDAGSIGVIEGMIGTPDYTRDEIVDSTINTSLENLNAAVEAKLRGTGTKNTKYTPYIPIENATPEEEEIIKNYYSDPNDPDNLKMYQDLRTKKGF